MGFKHIYLVGCDYTHLKTRALHFYEKGQGFDYDLPPYEEEFLSAAKEFIDITTITVDGTGEILNSVTYKEHTGCEPIFQENDQLVDKKHLEALNEWHNYSNWAYEDIKSVHLELSTLCNSICPWCPRYQNFSPNVNPN